MYKREYHALDESKYLLYALDKGDKVDPDTCQQDLILCRHPMNKRNKAILIRNRLRFSYKSPSHDSLLQTLSENTKASKKIKKSKD